MHENDVRKAVDRNESPSEIKKQGEDDCGDYGVKRGKKIVAGDKLSVSRRNRVLLKWDGEKAKVKS